VNAKEKLLEQLKERAALAQAAELNHPSAGDPAPAAGTDRPDGPAAEPTQKLAALLKGHEEAVSEIGAADPRSAFGRHAIKRLEAQLHAATRRAEKAETALAELHAKIVVVWESNQEKNRRITHLQAVANARAREAKAAVARANGVKAVNEKVWRMQHEITRLKAAAKARLQPRREAACVAMRKVRKLLRRIDELEKENETLRKHTNGESA
jgi:chromosome segregation ATPase